MPESPRWLVSKDRDAEAKEVLKMLYPDGYDVEVIVQNIKEGIKKESFAEHAMGWYVEANISISFGFFMLLIISTH